MSSDDEPEWGEGALEMTLVYADPTSVLLSLVGRFDAVEAPRVRRLVESEDIAAATHLTVDLSEVDFVDSAGLAVLARARRDRALSGGSVTLIRPRSEDAMRVFRLTQFDQIFTMRESRDWGAR